MAELLTRQIAVEYRNRARRLPDNGRQDIGERRALRMELQARCNLTELEAVNIINGCHIGDYVVLAERREEERKKKEQEEWQCGQRKMEEITKSKYPVPVHDRYEER